MEPIFRKETRGKFYVISSIQIDAFHFLILGLVLLLGRLIFIISLPLRDSHQLEWANQWVKFLKGRANSVDSQKPESDSGNKRVYLFIF